MKTKDEIINELLDAAFRVLQHDTGPTEPEYVHGRAALAGEFRKTLRGKINVEATEKQIKRAKKDLIDAVGRKKPEGVKTDWRDGEAPSVLKAEAEREAGHGYGYTSPE